MRETPAGLFTDVDGTISPIAPTPEEATVSPAASATLEGLSRRLRLVAAVSGRASRQALGMVGQPGLVYIGNHGLEELVNGEVRTLPEAEAYASRVSAVLGRAREQLRLPGVLVEDKGVTGTVHYRLARDPEAARAEILRVLAPLAEEQGVALRSGRMVVEIRPPLDLGKGAAVRRMVERYDLRGCVYLGDDVTDTDAFRAVREMSANGAVRGISVGVLSAETPPGVVDLSDFQVEGVDRVVELLGWLERSL